MTQRYWDSAADTNRRQAPKCLAPFGARCMVTMTLFISVHLSFGPYVRTTTDFNQPMPT